MTPAQLKAWRAGLLLSQKDAALQLGISERHVQLMEKGKRPISRQVDLACVGLWYLVGSLRGTLRWQSENMYRAAYPWFVAPSDQSPATLRRRKRKFDAAVERPPLVLPMTDNELVSQYMTTQQAMRSTSYTTNAYDSPAFPSSWPAGHDSDSYGRARVQLEEEYRRRRMRALGRDARLAADAWYSHSLRVLDQRFA